jgi:selenocysteine lyase/cysteine desulfurase
MAMNTMSAKDIRALCREALGEILLDRHYFNWNYFGVQFPRVLEEKKRFEQMQIRHIVDPVSVPFNALSRTVDLTRRAIAMMVSACGDEGAWDPDRVMFEENMTSTVERVLCTFSPDTEVLITDCEYPAVVATIYKKCPNIKYVQVSDCVTVEQILSRFEHCVSKDLKLLLFSNVTYNYGLKMPCRQIIDICKSINPRLKIFIDGAQALGNVNVDLSAFRGYDYYGTNGYKWLGGPLGTGIMIPSVNNLEEIAIQFHGNAFAVTPKLLSRLARQENRSRSVSARWFGNIVRSDSRFPEIAALKLSVDTFANKIGMANIERENQALARLFITCIRSCKKRNFAVLTPMEDDRLLTGIVTLKISKSDLDYSKN